MWEMLQGVKLYDCDYKQFGFVMAGSDAEPKARCVEWISPMNVVKSCQFLSFFLGGLCNVFF